MAHDEFLKYIEDNPHTPVEFTSFTAPWQEMLTLEEALEIAAEYWYDRYNIKAGDTDSETGYPYAILPKDSDNANYCIALACLVEGTHYSTIEMIEIDSRTGEVIDPAGKLISPAKALQIASEYWQTEDGYTDYAAGSMWVYRIMLLDDRSYEENGYYHIGLQVDHYGRDGNDLRVLLDSSMEHLFVNAVTSECQEYVPIYDKG